MLQESLRWPVTLVGLSAAVFMAAPALGIDPGNQVLRRALATARGELPRSPHRQRLSTAPLYAALQASGELTRRAERFQTAAASPSTPPFRARTQGCQNVYSAGRGPNGNPLGPQQVRVNQDCSRRRQAEEVIAVNPTDPSNLIVGQNDSRLGFNHCGFDWSVDGGRTWGDQVPPFYQFTLGDGHSADACSDPTVTFDAQGNAYAGSILFDINAAASALVVAKSNAGIGGAYFHTPQPGPFQTYQVLPLGVVASDNDPNIFNDKPFMAADANAASPKANALYIAWARFDSGAGNSPIRFSQSTDGGATWSPGIEISQASPTLCTIGSGETNKNACDQDQGALPVVGADGTVYVTFSNSNTPQNDVQQFLIVSCPPTANCAQLASWTPPRKIADDHNGQPIGPSTISGCEDGEQCLPPNGYRLDDSLSGSLSVDRASTLYFVWSDFRNGGGTCTGAAATATPPCDNDVFFVFSTDRGATWSAPRNVTPASRFGATAQWQPWSAVRPNGGLLWVAYYDRSYGNCEFDGCNDITLVRIDQPASAAPAVTYGRLTTTSMPALTPATNPEQSGFLGDYMWMTVDAHGRPYVVWADTRGLNGAADEDVYFAKGFPPP